MRLTQLPNELIAQIGSFLNFEENFRFLLVNKRIHAVLKRDGLNKPQVHTLSLSDYDDGDKPYLSCHVHLEERGKLVNLPNIVYGEAKEKNELTLDLIKKFRSIDRLELGGLPIQFYEGCGWDTIKTKIGSVTFWDPKFVVSKETVLKILKQFKSVSIIDSNMDPSYINDEFFAQLCANGTTVFFQEESPFLHVSVSDVTLDHFFKICIPKEFDQGGLLTDFSFGKIKKLIEDAVSAGMTELKWDFGYLKDDQYHEVLTFFSEEKFKEWRAKMKMPLYPMFDLWQPHNWPLTPLRRFYIHHRRRDEDDFSITFGVCKPIGYIEDDNEIGGFHSEDEDYLDEEEPMDD